MEAKKEEPVKKDFTMFVFWMVVSMFPSTIAINLMGNPPLLVIIGVAICFVIAQHFATLAFSKIGL